MKPGWRPPKSLLILRPYPEKGDLDKKGEFTIADPVAPGDYQVFFIGTKGMPDKYISETSSDYIVTVKDEANQLTIDIKS